MDNNKILFRNSYKNSNQEDKILVTQSTDSEEQTQCPISFLFYIKSLKALVINC